MVLDLYSELVAKGLQPVYLLLDLRCTSHLFGDIVLYLDGLVSCRWVTCPYTRRKGRPRVSLSNRMILAVVSKMDLSQVGFGKPLESGAWWLSVQRCVVSPLYDWANRRLCGTGRENVYVSRGQSWLIFPAKSGVQVA